MSENIDGYEAFENAIQKNKDVAFYELKLFITGITPNSVSAVRNIRNICSKYLNENKYSLEVIDVYQNANHALDEDVIATPTLIIKKPTPERKLIGDLSDTEKVLNLLSIDNKK